MDRYTSFDAYASQSVSGDESRKWFIGGMSEFMFVFPLTAWFYVGIESLYFAYDIVENRHVDIPIGYI